MSRIPFYSFVIVALLLCDLAGAQPKTLGPLDSLDMEALWAQLDVLEKQPRQETNWYVLAGPPCAGKSTLIEALAWRGFVIRPEAARLLLAEEKSRGRSSEECFAMRNAQGHSTFSLAVLKLKLDAEAKANVDDLIFWDRALPDSLAIRRGNGADLTPFVRAQNQKRYKGVFMLEPPVEFEDDGVRTETPEIARLQHQNLIRCYTDFGYNIITVPVMPVSERADFILEKIGN